MAEAQWDLLQEVRSFVAMADEAIKAMACLKRAGYDAAESDASIETVRAVSASFTERADGMNSKLRELTGFILELRESKTQLEELSRDLFERVAEVSQSLGRRLN